MYYLLKNTIYAIRYRISSWSLKLNMASDTYTLRLTLERLSNQRSMDNIVEVPKPSQLDHWRLYEELESTRIRETEGKAKLDDWIAGRSVERIERTQWRYSRNSTVKHQEQGLAADVVEGWAQKSGGSSNQPKRRKLSDIETDLLPPSEVPEEDMEQ